MATIAATAVAAVVPLAAKNSGTVRHDLEDRLSDGDGREPEQGRGSFERHLMASQMAERVMDCSRDCGQKDGNNELCDASDETTLSHCSRQYICPGHSVSSSARLRKYASRRP